MIKPVDPVGAARAVTRGEAKSTAAQTAAPKAQAAPAATPAAASVAVKSASELVDAPIVDTERVAQIRKAVDDGSYPIVPTKIADAMIAAGYILRRAQ